MTTRWFLRTLAGWLQRSSLTAIGIPILLLGTLVLCLAMTGQGGPASALLGPLLLAGLFPAFLMADDDDPDGEDLDEGAKTIVGMPVWMIEEMAKKAGGSGQSDGAGDPEAPPGPSTMAFEPAEADIVRAKMAGSEEPTEQVSVAPPASDIPAPEPEVDLGNAATVMFSPAETASFRDALPGLQDSSATPAEPEPEPEPEEVDSPQSTEDSAEEEEDDSLAQTLTFDSDQALEFREQFKALQEQQQPPQPEPPPKPDDLGSAQTLMFDPTQATEFQEALKGQGEISAPEEPAPEPETAGSSTMMFDPSQSDQLKQKIEESRTQDAPDAGMDQTMAYSPDELRKIRDMAQVQMAQDEIEDDAPRTVAYMPAVDEDAASPGPAAEPEDEGHAATMAYMPAMEGSQTAAYSAEDRDKLLASLQQGGSGDQADALKEAYALLEQSQKPGGAAQARAQADELLKQQTSAVDSPVQTATPQSVPLAPPVQSPLPEYGTQMEIKSGMGTGSLVVILLLLLVLAGGATAFILHFLGVVDLPIEGLPQLELFSKE